MRSVLEVFGDIALAVKDTDVYSADELDWGTIDARFLRAQGEVGTNLFHRTGKHQDAAVVFVAKQDFASIDGFIPFICSGAASTPTAKTLIGPQVDTIFGAAPKKGIAYVLPVPLMHERYMRAGCTPKSTGVFTAKTVHAFIEYGPNDM
jgi:hypothetical protein